MNAAYPIVFESLKIDFVFIGQLLNTNLGNLGFFVNITFWKEIDNLFIDSINVGDNYLTQSFKKKTN